MRKIKLKYSILISIVFVFLLSACDGQENTNKKADFDHDKLGLYDEIDELKQERSDLILENVKLDNKVNKLERDLEQQKIKKTIINKNLNNTWYLFKNTEKNYEIKIPPYWGYEIYELNTLNLYDKDNNFIFSIHTPALETGYEAWDFTSEKIRIKGLEQEADKLIGTPKEESELGNIILIKWNTDVNWENSGDIVYFYNTNNNQLKIFNKIVNSLVIKK